MNNYSVYVIKSMLINEKYYKDDLKNICVPIT